ncbi:MAG: AraC family transcriptional regulator, partial [Verrucomicrobiae bacterium]|nr:AraC family transcriptional regulator [Verrucomicrobiae bacterium]
ISNVALQTGYCDQSHFTKVFQKYFSVSPMEYRRKHMLK